MNETNKKYWVDLHMHTRYSDGMDRIQYLVGHASSFGIDVIAITDHDHTAGYYAAQEQARDLGIKMLTGTEISTTRYHILGYDFDIENRTLQSLLEHSRDIQIQQTKSRIDIIRDSGVPISYEKLKKCNWGRFGKLNILITLMEDGECSQYLNLPFDSIKEKKIWDELRLKYTSKGGIADKCPIDSDITPKMAIDAIHAAGGKAILAHPTKDIDEMKELDQLVKEGIDGLEMQPNYSAENNYEEFRKYAQEHNLILTYGSDYHGQMIGRPLLKKGENLIDKFWRD
jgi:hypothetical protein